MRRAKDHLQTTLRWLPALFFAVLIFIFSATPGKQVARSFERLDSGAAQVITPSTSQQPEEKLQRLLPETIDWLKVGHAIGYFCLGFTVLFGIDAYTRRGALSAQVMCSLYAVADEFHQNFTPGRSASGSDVLLDSIAACGGIHAFARGRENASALQVSLKPGQVDDAFAHRLAADFNPGMRLKIIGYTMRADAQITDDAAPGEHPAQGQGARQTCFHRPMQACRPGNQAVQAFGARKSTLRNYRLLPCVGGNAQSLGGNQAQGDAKNKKGQPGLEQDKPIEHRQAPGQMQPTLQQLQQGRSPANRSAVRASRVRVLRGRPRIRPAGFGGQRAS
jgi:VanZ family protein